MDAIEKAKQELEKSERGFWKYWNKRWPFISASIKVLELSANYRETRSAYFAGYRDGHAALLGSENPSDGIKDTDSIDAF